MDFLNNKVQYELLQSLEGYTIHIYMYKGHRRPLNSCEVILRNLESSWTYDMKPNE